MAPWLQVGGRVIARLNTSNVWHQAHVVAVWRHGRERLRRVDTECGIKVPRQLAYPFAGPLLEGQPNCLACIRRMRKLTALAGAVRARRSVAAQ